MALGFLQAHFQGSLEVCIETVVYSCSTRLHPLAACIRALPQSALASTRTLKSRRSLNLVSELSVTSIVNPDRLHDAEMRQWNILGAASTTENISTIPAVVFAVGEGEFLAASHAYIGIGPFGWCGAVKHAAGDFLPGRKVESLVLKRSIALSEIVQAVFSLRSNSPVLYELEYLASHLGVASIWRLQKADQVVHKFSASDLLHKMAASILGTRIGKVEGCELDVWILVAYPAL